MANAHTTHTESNRLIEKGLLASSEKCSFSQADIISFKKKYAVA